MSKRSQRPSPKPAQPPRTLADLAKLPREERIALLRREVAAVETHIAQAQHDLAHARGLLAAAEAF